MCTTECPSIVECSELNTVAEVDRAVRRYRRRLDTDAWPDYRELAPVSVRHLLDRAA
jgi:hypothetical protein